MAFEYNESKLIRKRVNILNGDRAKIMVDKFPLYILPNGQIYYSSTDHSQAVITNNLREIRSFLRSSFDLSYVTNVPFLVCENTLICSEVFKNEVMKFSFVFTNYFDSLIKKYNGLDVVNIKYIPRLEFDLLASNSELEYVTYDEMNFEENLRRNLYYIIKFKKEVKSSYDVLSDHADELIHIAVDSPYQKYDLYSQDMYEILRGINDSKSFIYSSFYDLNKKNKNVQSDLANLLKKYSDRSMASDILVRFCGLDKIETQIDSSITTSRNNINEVYFNYLLMDYSIYKIGKIVYCSDKNEFSYLSVENFHVMEKEEELGKEIEYIKKHVPYNERSKFFR